MRSRSLCPAVVLLLTATLHLGLFDPSSAAERRKFVKPPTYQTAVLMEPRTGQSLTEAEPHKLWPPATLTNTMTLLILMETPTQAPIKLPATV